MPTNLSRCWNTTNPVHIKYHDEEWGFPLHDDQRFFEFLVLGGFQAGLTWWLILQRREHFREAFDGFDPKKVAGTLRLKGYDVDHNLAYCIICEAGLNHPSNCAKKDVGN